MTFKTSVVSPDDFNTWVASVRASSTPLSKDVFATLEAPSEDNIPTTYAPVDLSLYTHTINTFMMPIQMKIGDMQMGTSTP